MFKVKIKEPPANEADVPKEPTLVVDEPDDEEIERLRGDPSAKAEAASEIEQLKAQLEEMKEAEIAKAEEEGKAGKAEKLRLQRKAKKLKAKKKKHKRKAGKEKGAKKMARELARLKAQLQHQQEHELMEEEEGDLDADQEQRELDALMAQCDRLDREESRERKRALKRRMRDKKKRN